MPESERRHRPQSAAEAAVGIVPADPLRDYGDVRRYGAVGDGRTDNVAAFQRAMAQAAQEGGAPVVVPEGTWNLASALLPLALASNTTVRGAGVRASRLVVVGDTPRNLFTSLNGSRISLSDLTCRGNSAATPYDAGSAIVFTQDRGATRPGGAFRIERMRFENFRGNYWLWFLNVSDTHAMRDIQVTDCQFQSERGNSIAPDSIAQVAACIAFQGDNAGSRGLVADAVVRSNRADCTFIKTFGAAWHSTSGIRFQGNTVLEAGRVGAHDHCGAYAFFAYNNSQDAGGAKPDQIFIEDNTIANPRSAGIYVADANRIYCRRNRISGQSDTMDWTLPKAAIAVNEALFADVSHNQLRDNYAGIVSLQGTGAEHVIVHNRITSSRKQALGIRLGCSFRGQDGTWECIGNVVDLTGSGALAVDLVFEASRGAARLAITHNTFRATSVCLSLTSREHTTPAIRYAEISSNKIVGHEAAYGVRWTSAADGRTQALIQNNDYSGTWKRNATLLDVRGSSGLTIRSETFHDRVGTDAIVTDDARGRLETIRFVRGRSAQVTQTWAATVLGPAARTETETQ